MGVEPWGREMTLPLGVNTKTSSSNMSTFREWTYSSASVSCWLSSRRRIHSKSFSSPVVWMPCLYFQWAAMPYSAVWCISHVRICTSKGMPSVPMTVVCRDWYMFGFGVEI